MKPEHVARCTEDRTFKKIDCKKKGYISLQDIERVKAYFPNNPCHEFPDLSQTTKNELCAKNAKFTASDGICGALRLEITEEKLS